MKRALVYLAPGFEELEAVSIVDVLRRGGVEVRVVALGGNKEVEGAHGIRVGADVLLPEDVAEAAALAVSADAIALPGGMGGMRALRASSAVLDALRAVAARGAVVAAVCAAPAVLDAAGLLAGRRFCCYPGIEESLSGAGTYVPDVPTVVDGNVVTGTGPGTAALFAAEVLRALGGPASDVSSAMLLR